MTKNMNKTLKTALLPTLVFGVGILGGYAITNEVYLPKEKTDAIESAVAKQKRPADFVKRQIKGKTTELNFFSDKDLKRFVQRIDKGLKPSDFEKEFKKLLQYSISEDKSNLYFAMMHLVSQWGKLDPHAALEAIMNLSGEISEMKKFFIPFALSSLIEKDPSQAASLFSNTDSKLYAYPSILPAISQSLTRKSPEEAWKWMASLKVQEQNQALGTFFEELSHTAPERIGEFVGKLQPSEEWGRGGYEDRMKLEKIIDAWATANYEETEEWVKAFTEEWKNELMPKLLEVKAKKDPEGALTMMLELPKYPQSKAFKQIGEAVFASGNEEKISIWLDSVNRLEPDIIPDYYSFLDGINPTTRLKMVENQPPGKVKDAMIAYSVTYDLNSDYDVDLRLVEQIKDPVLREKSKEIAKKNKSAAPTK